MRPLVWLLVCLMIVSPVLPLAAEQPGRPPRNLQVAVKRVLLRAVLSRELTAREYWQFCRVLRNPEAAAQLDEFVEAGLADSGVATNLEAIDWGAVMDWLWAHREEIMEFLFLLFLLDPPTADVVPGFPGASADMLPQAA